MATMIAPSAEQKIRTDIFRACAAERERQIGKGYDAAHDDAVGDGPLPGLAVAVAAGSLDVVPLMMLFEARRILRKHKSHHARMMIAHALLTAELERLARAKGQPQPRIEVARLDPEKIVGIDRCNDGDPGWVVLVVQPDPDAPNMDTIAPFADEHGELVYMDINDAAEILSTGVFWKHDMDEGEADGTPSTAAFPNAGDCPPRPSPAQWATLHDALCQFREGAELVVEDGPSRDYMLVKQMAEVLAELGIGNAPITDAGPVVLLEATDDPAELLRRELERPRELGLDGLAQDDRIRSLQAQIAAKGTAAT